MTDCRTDSYNPLIDDPGFEMDIITAASRGDFRLVQRLLAEGANASAVNSSGWTPLMYASHYGHFGVVRVLLEAGCLVDQREWQDQRTALMLAASNGHTKCLDLLVNTGGADIMAADSSGRTAADYAVTHGHGDNQIIRQILKIGKSNPLQNQKTPEVTSGRRWNQTNRMSNGLVTSPLSAPTPYASRVHSSGPSSPKKSRSVCPVGRINRNDAIANSRKRIDFELRRRDGQKALPESMSELLHRLDLQMYENVFHENGVDLLTFADLSEQDLIQMGIAKLGHRKRLLVAQMRLVESVQIHSAEEAIFADYLLVEKSRLQQENERLITFIAQCRQSVSQALEFVSKLLPNQQISPIRSSGQSSNDSP